MFSLHYTNSFLIESVLFLNPTHWIYLINVATSDFTRGN